MPTPHTVIEDLSFPPKTISFWKEWKSVVEAAVGARHKGLNVQFHNTPRTTYMSADVYSAWAEDNPDVEHKQYLRLHPGHYPEHN